MWPGDTRRAAWRRRCPRNSALARQRCSTPVRNSALLPWYAASRPKVGPAGPCDWLLKRPSNARWCHAWGEKPSGFCSWTTTSSRGGKKMWCVAELDDEYVGKMEDVLEIYEKPYDLAEPVICFDEK